METRTLTLTEFLLARIAEDEAVAKSTADGGSGRWASWNRSWDSEPVRDIACDGERIATVPVTLDEFICTHDPARVLSECEVKRRMVEDFNPWSDGDEWRMKLLATVYADHPDYRDEWRP